MDLNTIDEALYEYGRWYSYHRGSQTVLDEKSDFAWKMFQGFPLLFIRLYEEVQATEVSKSIEERLCSLIYRP